MIETKSRPSDPRIDLASIEAELRPQSTDRLRAAFVESYGRAAEFVARAAVCVKLLEERGESLQGMPLLATFRRIACGQVLPELVWKFVESPARAAVERLPLPDQSRLVREPRVPVAVPEPGGGFTHLMQDLTKAPREVVRQVVGPEGVRSPEEQIAYLMTQRARSAAAPQPDAEPASDGPRNCRLTLRLTTSELAALQVNAARARVSPAKLAIRALAQSGALREK